MKLFKTATEKKVERIAKLYQQMRKNSEDMRMWKNLPLAKECVGLLREIDDPKESAMDKAMGCVRVAEQLPEFDVPRMVLGILRYALELIEHSGEDGKEDYPTAQEVSADIRLLEDYIDVEHVSYTTFMERYNRHLHFDPIMRNPAWEESYYEVEQECDRRLGDMPRGMGFCFAYWSTLADVLAEHGVEWHSPSQLNPRVMFD